MCEVQEGKVVKLTCKKKQAWDTHRGELAFFHFEGKVNHEEVAKGVDVVSVKQVWSSNPDKYEEGKEYEESEIGK